VQAAAGLCVDAYRETLHPRSQPPTKSTLVRRSLHQPMMLLIVDGELQLSSRGRCTGVKMAAWKGAVFGKALGAAGPLE
jgi:hypothetical protein